MEYFTARPSRIKQIVPNRSVHNKMLSLLIYPLKCFQSKSGSLMINPVVRTRIKYGKLWRESNPEPSKLTVVKAVFDFTQHDTKCNLLSLRCIVNCPLQNLYMHASSSRTLLYMSVFHGFRHSSITQNRTQLAFSFNTLLRLSKKTKILSLYTWKTVSIQRKVSPHSTHDELQVLSGHSARFKPRWTLDSWKRS